MHGRGFTLIEVVVALLVVALALAAATGLTTVAAGNARSMQQKTLADWVAMDRLASLRLATSLPAGGSDSGQSAMGGQTFWWRQQVSAGALSQVRNVRIEVADRADGPALVTLQSSLAQALMQSAGNDLPPTAAAP